MSHLKPLSTENLIKAITVNAEGRKLVLKRMESDRADIDAGPLLARLDAVNNDLLHLYDVSSEVLKAELKRRLH